MPNYAGETVRVKVTIDDPNNVPIGTALSALVTILDSSGNWYLENQPLVYSSAYGYWFWDWPATSTVAGSFTAKATFTGANYVAYGYGRVNISPPKVTETGQQGFP